MVPLACRCGSMNAQHLSPIFVVCTERGEEDGSVLEPMSTKVGKLGEWKPSKDLDVCFVTLLPRKSLLLNITVTSGMVRVPATLSALMKFQ